MHDTAANLDTARREIVEVCRRMLHSGLVTGTSGNVSVRIADRVLITPSGLDYDDMAPDDLAVLDLHDGSVVEATSPPSSEAPLHLAVYRSGEATAVVHTHSPWATALGLVRDTLPRVHYAIRALGGPVRVAPYATFGSAELAEHVARALQDRRGALMRNHGAVTIGTTLAEAAANAEKLEWLCQLYCRAARLGEPAELTEAQLDDVTRSAETTGYRL
ncbi:class II aldolase/adducin family protein [Nocardioides deserti]|uniref:Class II aldolase/adducin family protein n=1 Tax=Nocardioides deserti TaxID=1588644 RepID=A0ABR6UC15_9ACTN|nr:class II aldolase/adducin family protein [Nocardioides deserti]MBC2961987.1 class II aldolase/adducin family protein [Nocardioides deserti]GGO70629.1 aldolase [Nocardioides deserti]